MDTKSHRINLTQKRKAENGQWHFYPVQWDGTKPAPRLIIIDEEPASWKGGGAFFLDWREGGKRKRKQVGKAPREALDAWRKATGVANGSIPDDGGETSDAGTDSPRISIEAGIKQYLDAVEATKGLGTHSSYQTCLTWAERHLTKRLVNRLYRNDLLGLFAAGRKEELNQKTINKRVTVVLNMVRHHDHDIKLKRGDWPKTTEKIKARQKTSQSLLVFPSAPHPTRKSYGGGIDSHMLEACKAVAFRAGLNCGHCHGTYTIKRSKTRKETVPYSCKTHPRCEQWFLHKWRHTFASHMIGVLGLKGLQLAMGHKDIATTSKYLHFLGGDGIKEKVEASALAKMIR